MHIFNKKISILNFYLHQTSSQPQSTLFFFLYFSLSLSAIIPFLHFFLPQSSLSLSLTKLALTQILSRSFSYIFYQAHSHTDPLLISHSLYHTPTHYHTHTHTRTQRPNNGWIGSLSPSTSNFSRGQKST